MRALFLTGGRRCEHAWLWAGRPVHIFHHALPPAINGPNTIGNAVVRTIGIEPTSGHQLVQSAEGRQPAADPDSRARTHLANERTFLAWLRTGLSLVAVGLAVAGFLPIDLVPGVPYVRSFSVLLVLCGTAMVVYGASRYVRAYRQIETGAYDPASTAVVTIAAIIAFL